MGPLPIWRFRILVQGKTSFWCIISDKRNFMLLGSNTKRGKIVVIMCDLKPPHIESVKGDLYALLIVPHSS